MRNILLVSGLVAIVFSCSASTKYLYRQNFDKVKDIEETGWSFEGTSMTIKSDEEGNYLELSLKQEQSKSGILTWGSDIFMKDGRSVLEDNVYKIKFDFRIGSSYNIAQTNSITIFTNKAPINNTEYRFTFNQDGSVNWWQNYVFDMSQISHHSYQYVINGATLESDGIYSIDYSDPVTFEQNKWYTAEMNVNIDTRNVVYSVCNREDRTTVTEGTISVPEANFNGEAIDMYASGIFVFMGQNNSIFDFNNIEISCNSSEDIANTPQVFLSRIGQTEEGEIDLNLRAYSIYFLENETLHIIGTDGRTTDIEYAECNGEYTYETLTSGTLKAWTSIGGSISDIVETEIDCVPIKLPSANATLTEISEGFYKIYTLTVDNAGIPLSPTIMIDWEYIGDNGSSMYKKNAESGVKAWATGGKGQLQITTHAAGYESGFFIIENDTEYSEKSVWDFARMSEDQIRAVGFPELEILNSNSPSGFQNWTARKRLYYIQAGTEHENEEGQIVRDYCYPFGFESEDSETKVIKYSIIDRTEVESTFSGEFFDGLTIFPERGRLPYGSLPNVGMLYRIGLFNNQTNNNYNDVCINDLEGSDIVVVNTIANYGANSNHPLCDTDEEYYAKLAGENEIFLVSDHGIQDYDTRLYDLEYPLFRVDTAITKITVFKQVDSDTGTESIEIMATGNEWYSIDGVRIAEPTSPGLYIHNGKKIIVK